MKQLSYLFILVVGLLFYIPINYNFIFATLYFIVNLALVWGARKRGVIDEPVKNKMLVAVSVVILPSIYWAITASLTISNALPEEVTSITIKQFLKLGVIVLQFGMLMLLLNKPLFDRY